jgi:type I restriction enzyme, S subunit
VNHDVPRMTLGEFLQLEKRPVDLGDGPEEYPLVGVKWWGRGAFLREHKKGDAIRKKRHFQLRSGDVVYNKLFAWRGAFAIVDAELDGAFVSDKFPTYRLDEERVLADYFRLICGSKRLAKEAEFRSTGSAAISKFTLNPPRFLELEVAIPPVPAQERLVEFFADLDRYCEDLVASAETIRLQADAFPRQLVQYLCADGPRSSLGEVGRLCRRTVTIEDDEKYEQLTIAMNNRGVRYRDVKLGIDIGVKNQAHAHRGDVVFSRIDLRNGAIGIVPPELDGSTVANDFPIYELGQDILPQFAEAAFTTPDFRLQSIQKSAGSTNRKKIRRDAFLTIEIPFPELDKQRQTVEAFSAAKDASSRLSSGIKRCAEGAGSIRDALLDKVVLTGRLGEDLSALDYFRTNAAGAQQG